MGKPHVPQKNHNRQQMLAASVSQQYTGPFPHQDMLQAYEQTMPGAAERLLKYTEKNQDHRHTIEQKYLDNEHTRFLIGQWMAFAIAFLILVSAVSLVWMNKPIEGIVLVLGEISGIIYLFIHNRKLRKEQTEKKE